MNTVTTEIVESLSITTATTPENHNNNLVVELPYYVSGNIRLRSHVHRKPGHMASNHLIRFYALMIWGGQQVRDIEFTDAELQWLSRNVSYGSVLPSRCGLGEGAEDGALAATTFYDAIRDEVKWLLSEFPEEAKELGIETEIFEAKLDRLLPLGLMALVDLVERMESQFEAGSTNHSLRDLLDTIPTPIRVRDCDGEKTRSYVP